MKYLLLGVGLLLTLGGALRAQTDAQNLEKYWKLRNDFRDYFVKIGGAVKKVFHIVTVLIMGKTPNKKSRLKPIGIFL